MVVEMVTLGLACLLAPVLAEFGKVRSKAERGFNWIAVAGVLFLFAGSFGVAGTLGTYLGSAVWVSIAAIFEVIGWLFALIGTIFVGYETLVEK